MEQVGVYESVREKLFMKKYMEITDCKLVDGEFQVKVSIKWWGWFFLVAEILKESTELHWWRWVYYPLLVTKGIIRKWGR
jgi:hypothetical protein